MSIIDVAPLVSMIAGTATSVGAVGVASLGIKSLITTFKHLRATGMGVREASHEAKRIHEEQINQNARQAIIQQVEADDRWESERSKEAIIQQIESDDRIEAEYSDMWKK